ncbi:MAG: TIGR03564 family F420-dependent LLM class oxidoreductase [Myxococcota bacterium]
MRIGVMIGTHKDRRGLDSLVEQARDLDARGFATVWLPQVFGLDAVTTAAVLGRETARIEIGTAVVPTQPRHPSALAQQALTAGVACGGRFTLGIGLSHPVVIERILGLSYARRAAHMREYLEVLGPLLGERSVHHEGEEFRVDLDLELPDARPVPVVVAALGERMLELAGRLATGTILWMTGPRTIESHIAPRVRAAAREAGRPEPRIVAGVNIALTTNPAPILERLAKRMGIYRTLPSYRAMLEREGDVHPVDLALIGDEEVLDAGLARLQDAGVSDFETVVVHGEEGAEERTLAYLESRL